MESKDSRKILPPNMRGMFPENTTFAKISWEIEAIRRVVAKIEAGMMIIIFFTVADVSIVRGHWSISLSIPYGSERWGPQVEQVDRFFDASSGTVDLTYLLLSFRTS